MKILVSDILVVHRGDADEPRLVALGKNPSNAEDVRVSRCNDRMQHARAAPFFGQEGAGAPAGLFGRTL